MFDSSHEHLSHPSSPVMETFHQQEKVVQSRSSSLSDIEDHADEETAQSGRGLPSTESDQNDTEAETERLEDSPQKMRKTQNLVFSAANSVHQLGQDTQTPPGPIMSDTMQPGSDAASPSISSAGEHAVYSPRKRKRSEIEHQELNDQRRLRDSGNSSSASSNSLVGARPTNPGSQPDKSKVRHEATDKEDEEYEEETPGDQITATFKGKGIKRRNRKFSDEDTRMHSSSGSVNGVSEPLANAGVPDSNGDDVEMDDTGERAGFESPVKDDESTVKKKSALDSLSAIEKCFGSLREKLYDERLAKCEAELAMLAESTVTHPDLLSIKAVLEQRCEEKIQYEDKLLKYKFSSLENKSKAEKAQVHGQYIQSVREIRDQNLENANREWYQIHKERRSQDDDVPEYIYQFPTQRSQQIINQTAYNKEVSLLSGIAKYRGFPAAPELRGAKPTEIDSDFEKMGIIQQPTAPSTRHPPMLRTSTSSTAVLPRPRAFADEHFLEQNPWANPQHPAHLHRQASVMSRTVSPLVGPAMQNRPTEPGGNSQAVATRLEPDSRPYLPSGLTPASGQQDGGLRKAKLDVGVGARPGARTSTPNELLLPASENLTVGSENKRNRLERTKMPLTMTSEKVPSSGIGGRQGQDSHVKAWRLNKMSHMTDSPNPGSASKLPASPSSRFPNIKNEDAVHFSDQSLAPQQYHHQVSVNHTANGPDPRFTIS